MKTFDKILVVIAIMCSAIAAILYGQQNGSKNPRDSKEQFNEDKYNAAFWYGSWAREAAKNNGNTNIMPLDYYIEQYNDKSITNFPNFEPLTNVTRFLNEMKKPAPTNFPNISSDSSNKKVYTNLPVGWKLLENECGAYKLITPLQEVVRAYMDGLFRNKQDALKWAWDHNWPGYGTNWSEVN